MQYPAITRLRDIEPFGVWTDESGTIRSSSGIRSYQLFDSSGARVGELYGHVLAEHHGPNVHVDGDTIRTKIDKLDEHTFVRELVYGLHGIFVAVSGGYLTKKLYLDFGGNLPIVWDKRTLKFGSSTALILSRDDYFHQLNRCRYERLIEGEGHGWIAGTLTCHDNIKRLLPGHSLNLNDGTVARVWPHKDELKLGMSLEDAASVSSVSLKSFCEAVASQYDAALTLTAGFDSRILLAATKNVRNNMEYVTFGQEDEGVDQYVAAKMAAQLQLRHRLIPIVKAEPDDQKEWDWMVGHAMKEVNRTNHPTLARISKGAIITGMYGEIGRARLYRQDIDTINERAATTSFVLARLTLPQDPELVREVDDWLEPISWMPRSMVLDMAFNELKFGSWAMGQAPAQKALMLSFAPFAQLKVQSAFLQADPLVKGTEALFRSIGHNLWPEVLTFPVNRYGNWRDRLGKFAKLTRRESVVRYLRDRMAR